jgi:hypothetical protein
LKYARATNLFNLQLELKSGKSIGGCAGDVEGYVSRFTWSWCDRDAAARNHAGGSARACRDRADDQSSKE